MGKTSRLFGAVVLAGLTVPFLGVAPASAAATTTAPATAQGYFYASGISKPDPSPAKPPNLTAAVDGVDPGNLAVAAKGGSEDKVSAVLFDLSTLEPGSLVTKAVMTLPLAAGGENLQLSAAPEKVRACAAGETGFGGEDGENLSLAPARLCKVFAAPAKASADAKSYDFDITTIAATWVDGMNDGVTLTAAEGAISTNFQVVFQNALKTAKLALEYSAPAADFVPPVAPPVSSGTTTTPDFSSGFSGGVAPAPSVGTGFGSVAAPVVPEAPAPAPGVAPAAPVVAAPAAATGPVALSTSLRPTGQFWLAALILAAAFLLLSLILGDATVPQASTRPSRLARALADRQRGVSASRPTFSRPATI